MNIIDREFFYVGVIKAPLPQLTDAFAGLFHPVLSRAIALNFPLQQAHAEVDELPLALWTPCCSPGLTAFMPHRPSVSRFVAAYATERFGFAAVEVRSTTKECEYPINEFVAHPGGNSLDRRIVRAFRDEPRWDFYVDGPPLPFENEGAYSARFVRDRFTRPMLLDYLELWGAPIRNQDFWRTDKHAVTLVRTYHGS